MARGCFLSTVLSILGQVLGAHANSHADTGTAQEGIQVPMMQPKFTENITAAAMFHPHGWYDPNICEGVYCVYSNRGIYKGRGLTLITASTAYQKVRRLEKVMKDFESTYMSNPPLFEEKEVPESDEPNKIGIFATKPIRRATGVMEITPAILIHKTFFNHTNEAAQGRLLEAAFHLLPDATRDLLAANMAKSKHGANPKDAVLSHPFETSTGSTPWDPADQGKHYALYPEMFILGHDCRPNMAFYIDNNHAMRLSAVRKVQPGERLTVSYINPRLTRKERAEVARTVWGRPCSCHRCTGGGGDLSLLAAADANWEEILAIEEQLKDMESKRVTTGMLQRYLQLMEEEGLHSKFAEAYELLAYNYNYLGYEKRALKYANLAIQAGVIEAGPDSNDVVAMRVFMSGPREHYSWQRKLKKAGV